MIFELNDYHRNISDNELIDDLKSVADVLGKNTVTLEEYNEYGRYSSSTLTRRFGSWFKCLDLAGLAPSRPKIGITNEELFEDIEHVWIRIGKQPTYAQMRDLSRFSIRTYENRFGSWRKALEAFVEYINGNSAYEIESGEVSLTRAENKHKTSRTINLRTRFLVFQRDNFKCCICGSSPAKNSAVVLHIDHIMPWSKGGETVVDNLQTLCSECNLGKSNLY